jgi:Zn-dependent protease
MDCVGGVLAQLAIAIPVLAIGSLTEDFDLGYFATTIVFLGYFNLLVALFNLAPGPGMDGQIAWRVVPMLKGRIRARRKTNAVLTTFRQRR